MAKTRKIRVNVGIPASGKTTESVNFISKNPDWCKVSRDEIRFMLQGRGKLDYKGEELVTKIFFQTAKSSLLMGYNVILDATHCSKKHIEKIIEELGHLGDIEYRIFDAPLDLCLKRDAARESRYQVGEEKIKTFHQKLVDMLQTYPLVNRKKSSKKIPDYTKEWNPELATAVIFDIDGTLAHMGDKRSPFDWGKVYLDTLDEIIAHQVKLHKESGDTIILVSGREESCREITEEWFKLHGIEYDHLFMRPANDWRKDSVIKKEIYGGKIQHKWNIRLVYDDRDQVVKTWRDLGLKCLQVEPGDF